MPDQQFKKTFRMNRSCFEELLCRIRRETHGIKHIRKSLYIFIFYVTHQNTLRKMREIFGLPNSSIYEMLGKLF